MKGVPVWGWRATWLTPWCWRAEASGRSRALTGSQRRWIYELLGRYRAGGYEALEPRSRRPRCCPHQTPPGLVDEILRLRREAREAGHDCGPATIRYHLPHDREDAPCRATIWRILKRDGLIVPQPQKRPVCSRIRFEADLPNEMWQTDFTYWQLADGQPAEILNLIDDHSRLFLGSDAYHRVKAADVVASFHKAAQLHGLPYSLLSDNGAVFTGSPRNGKVLLESELERLGVLFKNSRPYHPQTCGKIERLHQTLKRYLAKQPPPATLSELQDPARRLRPLLQPHQATPSPRRPQPAAGLQRPHQGQTRQPTPPTPTSGSARTRSTRPAKSASATEAASTKSAIGRAHKGRTNQAPDRRRPDPRHRPQRPAPPRAHARHQPRLPAPQPRLDCPGSPETRVRDHPRLHKTERMKGFEPSTFAMARRRSSQLSYIREVAGILAPAPKVGPAPTWAGGRRVGRSALEGRGPWSPKGSSRSRTASRKPASAARRWKA